MLLREYLCKTSWQPETSLCIHTLSDALLRHLPASQG